MVKKFKKKQKRTIKIRKIFCDEISETFRSLNNKLNLTNDDFIRSTEERHYKSVK